MKRRTKGWLCAAIVIAVTAGAIAYRSWTAATVEETWAAAQPVEKLAAQDMVTLAGRVVRPDGSAAAGAKVVCVSHFPSDLGESALATTAKADGTFELPVPRGELAALLGARREVSLVASAEDYGLAWRSAAAFLPEDERKSSQQPVLKLTDDQALVGQVKTADGRPAPGVHLELVALWSIDGEDLGPWLDAVAKGEPFGKATWGRMHRYLTGQGLSRFAAATDAEGRFRLTGLGKNRLAALRVFGPDAASATVVARTMQGKTVTVNGLASAFLGDTQGCFGAEFSFEVKPSRPVLGVLKDADSGKPIADAILQSLRLAGSSVIPADALKTRSDAAGRFRLEGLPIGSDNVVLVRPTGEHPYVPAVVDVATTEGKGPVQLEVKLRRGLWVEGTVTDAKSKRPLFALITVFCPNKNPQLASFPGFRMVPPDIYRTDGKGRFRVPAMPGSAAVAVKVLGKPSEFFGIRSVTQAGRSYRLLDKNASIDGLPDDDEPFQNRYLHVRPWALEPAHYHRVRVIEVTKDAAPARCDFKLD